MQIVVDSIISGLLLALVAVAFQIVYLPTRVFFVGLAGIYSCGPFLLYSVLRARGGWFCGIAVSIIVSIVLSIFCELVNHAPLSKRQASSGAHLVASIGIYLTITQVLAITWGNSTKILTPAPTSALRIGTLVITDIQSTSFVISILLLIAYMFALQQTQLGLRLRALADNPTQFMLFGYNMSFHRLLVFGIAGFFTTVSSLLTAHAVGFDPYRGLPVIVLAAVAVIVGGRGSFAGPILGALLLSILRAQTIWHFSALWQEPVTFILLGFVLVLRPQGIFRRDTGLEVTV